MSQMDHAPSSPCGLKATAPRNIVKATTIASTNKPVKYQGTAGPSSGSIAQSSSGPRCLANSPDPSAIAAAAPVTDASTVKLGPASNSTRKYRHDPTPAPIPMPSENNQRLCSDQRTGCGN